MYKLLIGLLILCSASFAAADEKYDFIMCNQEYALCTSAKCIPDPRSPEKNALCNCQVFTGKSLGMTSCDKRKVKKINSGVKSLTSTFSYVQVPPKQMMQCPNGAVWTNCLDQPCIVDPTNPQQAICSCLIVTSGESVTYGGGCNTSTCHKAFWSAAAPTIDYAKAARQLGNNSSIYQNSLCKKPQ